MPSISAYSQTTTVVWKSDEITLVDPGRSGRSR